LAIRTRRRTLNRPAPGPTDLVLTRHKSQSRCLSSTTAGRNELTCLTPSRRGVNAASGGAARAYRGRTATVPATADDDVLQAIWCASANRFAWSRSHGLWTHNPLVAGSSRANVAHPV